MRRSLILACLLCLACRSAPAPSPAPVPAAALPRVFYQAFVRSFADANGDGQGDLQGIINHLDYLNDGHDGTGEDLEVDGLWLTPIHPSPSYHGYDVTDFLGVHPDFGNVETAQALFRRCRERGITVILDLVLNHTSDQHPWFQRARSGPASPWRSFYTWRGDNPGWTQPWGSGQTWHTAGDGSFFYGLFWQGMPDLNFTESRVANGMVDVARTWLARGAGGFRLDAVRYLFEHSNGDVQDLPETHAYLQRFRHALDGANPRHLLVGEVWSNPVDIASYWGGGKELHQAFDFPLAAAITDTVVAGHAPLLSNAWAAREATGTPWAYEATFLSNHDMERLASRLGSPEAVKAAWSILMVLPGTPFVYYGDELGMLQGTGSGDQAKRTPMAWDGRGGFSAGQPWFPPAPGGEARNVRAELADPDSVLQHLRKLVALRRTQGDLLQQGTVRFPETGSAEVLAVVRERDGTALVLVVNLGNEPAALPAGLLQGHAAWETVVGTRALSLQPRESRILIGQ